MAQNSLGNRVAVTNPLGKTTHHERDAWFRVTASTDPDANTTSTQFDVFGNVTEVTDPLGNITQFSYNDRVSTETWKQGDSTVRTLDFSYDTVDRLTALDDSDSLATDFQFAYDQRGQLVAERQLSGLIGTSIVFTRQFDDCGNRSELAANFGGTLSGVSVSGGAETHGGAIGGCRRQIACPGLTSDAASRRGRYAVDATQHQLAANRIGGVTTALHFDNNSARNGREKRSERGW